MYGVQFKVLTDNKPLKWMLKESNNDMVSRWLNELDKYSFTIHYKAGKENGRADELSRMPHEDEPDTQGEQEEVFSEWPIRKIKLTNIEQLIKPAD